ncbi:RING/U-box superfamily protein [Thalictrum thalictroides]|uniref:RBR-type E3 ubiquitin transferase n=1 Tax=Thalictrum thalictroides TaxID=46969 RepID=A0A7J6VWN6_THATH|nr:RING/U-box superfamily protein [Thalictrum thalictroides]
MTECNVSSFACVICLNNVSSNKRFKNDNRCVTHSYCVDCIEKYIKAKLEGHNLAEIKCPALDCNEVLDPLACSSILSPRLFERWCDVLCKSTLMQCQKTYCPFRNCSTLILNECEASVTKSTCPVCKRLFCFKCKRPWHAGYSCDEARGMTDRNDFLFGALMKSNKWKRCPICTHCVERKSGCSIIKCRCGIEFCYSCGEKIDDDRHRCTSNPVPVGLGQNGSALAKLDDYNLAEIKCPALDCNEVFDPLVCRSILSPRVFEKLCDKLCESTLTQCQKAYCPFQNCSTLILNECEASVTKSNCPVCKRLFCFKCGRPWHAGYSCDEARGMTDRNDILFGALMEARGWRRCPVCKHCVERTSGYVGSDFVIYVEAGEQDMIVRMLDGSSRQKDMLDGSSGQKDAV